MSWSNSKFCFWLGWIAFGFLFALLKWGEVWSCAHRTTQCVVAGVRTGRDAALLSLVPCYQNHWTWVLWFWKPHKTSRFPLLDTQLSSHKKTPKCKPKHGQPRATKAQWATGGEQGLAQRLCKVLYLPAHTANSIAPGARAAVAMQMQHPSPEFPNHQSPQQNQLNTSSLAVAHLWAHRFTTTIMPPRPCYFLCFQPFLQLLALQVAKMKQDPLTAT